MKQHKLLVEELREFEGSDNVVAYYSKGHHDKELFISRLDRAWGEVIYDWKVVPTVENVEHIYWRAVPIDRGEFGMMVHRSEKGRGAFPVTIWDVERLNVEWHLAQMEANMKQQETE